MPSECEALKALHKALDEMERFFDKRGALNSDGRKLVARAARIEARRGRRRTAQLLWNYLKNPTIEEAQRLAARLEEQGCP